MFEEIDFTNSYLLGWKLSPKTLSIYLELHLLPNHKKYHPFDSKKEFGCYKLGIMKFYEVDQVVGFSSENVLPRWNAVLAEYEDIEEINACQWTKNRILMEADTLSISFEFGKAEIVYLDATQFSI